MHMYLCLSQCINVRLNNKSSVELVTWLVVWFTLSRVKAGLSDGDISWLEPSLVSEIHSLLSICPFCICPFVNTTTFSVHKWQQQHQGMFLLHIIRTRNGLPDQQTDKWMSVCVCEHMVSVCGTFPPPHRSVSLQSHVKSLFTSVCLRPALSPWQWGNPFPITPSAKPFHSNPVTPPTIRGSKQRENEWVWGVFPCMCGEESSGHVA